MLFFSKKKDKIKEDEKKMEIEDQQQEMLCRKKEEERIAQMDAEARKKLQGDYKDRYLMAKELGLDLQAEIARVEGITNTVFVDLDEQRWLLEKAIVSNLGYAIGDDSCYPELGEAAHSLIEDFPGKIPYGALIRYQELKKEFDAIKILHFDLGSDPIMYGVRIWKGKELYFRIMMWV